MNKYLLVGQADHDNFGDSLIYLVYINMLRRNGCEAEILNPSSKFMSRLNDLDYPVDSIHSKNLKDIESKYKAIIFIPGGYLGCPDLTDIFWQKKWIKSDYFRSVFDNLDEVTIPVYMHGVECGPYLKPFVEKYFLKAFKKANKIFVRNTGSKDFLLKKYGIESVVLPDYIFSLKSYVDVGSVKKSFDLGIHITGKIFGSNFIAKRFMNNLIKSICDTDVSNILLFSDQVIPDKFKEQLENFKIKCNKNIEIRNYESLEKVIMNAASCKNIITSKLHVGVTGLIYDAKVISISSHPKLKRFYQDNNLSKFTINYFMSTSSSKKILINKVINMSNSEYFNDKLNRNIENSYDSYNDSLKQFIV